MSDTNVAAAPAAPAPAPAPTHEVPINQMPASGPNPIGSQAPSAPVPPDFKGSEHRPESRRETISKAFERARVERKGPAEAKVGHNQPPEETPKEKFDLKKRPAPERGDGGRFAAKERPEGTAQQAPGRQQKAAAQAPANPLPDNAPYRNPPPRMHARAQAEWATAPESVRGEVYRMHHEMQRAYQHSRADREVMDTIRPYHQMAQAHGTTLERALSNYVGMENKLRGDPIAGLDQIVNNLNLRTPQGQRITLQDIAWHVLNQTPDQHKLTQSANLQSAQSHQINQLQQQLSQLAQHQQRMQYQQRFAHTRRQVDQYAETHPRLDELGDLITRELKLGFDLDTAYRRADLLRPARGAPAAQTRTQTAQTRRSIDRSISGAPERGLHGASARKGSPPPSIRESVANAMRHVNGSL